MFIVIPKAALPFGLMWQKKQPKSETHFGAFAAVTTKSYLNLIHVSTKYILTNFSGKSKVNNLIFPFWQGSSVYWEIYCSLPHSIH